MSSRVFITYRHESEEHRQRVAAFAGRLRDAGADVILDQFFEEEHPGGPDEGWDRWSANQVKEADRILMIGSPGWFRCFEGTELPGTGLGAACEARLIFTQLYEAKWVSEKHRIVLLSEISSDQIPLEIKNFPRFRPDQRDPDLDRLSRWIRGDGTAGTSVDSPEALAWPEPVPGFQPDFADREEREWPSVVSLLSGQTKKRILLLEGKTNHGKSVFVRDCRRYALEAGIAVGSIDFKGGVINSPREVLAEIHLTLKKHLPHFSAKQGQDVFDLRQDLRETRQPILLIFDTYELVASDPEMTGWLESRIFAEVEHSPGLAIIVAGQKTPDPVKSSWESHTTAYELGEIYESEAWCSWIRPRFPAVARQIDSGEFPVEVAIQGNRGIPGSIAVFFENMEKFASKKPGGGVGS